MLSGNTQVFGLISGARAAKTWWLRRAGSTFPVICDWRSVRRALSIHYRSPGTSTFRQMDEVQLNSEEGFNLKLASDQHKTALWSTCFYLFWETFIHSLSSSLVFPWNRLVEVVHSVFITAASNATCYFCCCCFYFCYFVSFGTL